MPGSTRGVVLSEQHIILKPLTIGEHLFDLLNQIRNYSVIPRSKLLVQVRHPVPMEHYE